ncbi:hypothetical protein FisN_12Hh216 [Fistulifera solaris]|uniref:Uncharacterized protein n=1 Tax=Fistulifera solaris TaxID=1519565 RepID=A0A1Z5KBH5_FISSO|nr:hypothetical protein FisN_12Hh216 [Fistulifera solaris]|eukprot:GAX23643.1 hypothetical protein FisN_12Hh216 [Fistulifera solaris]
MPYNRYNNSEDDEDADGVDTIVRNANIFLDGESVILPESTYGDDQFADDVSSINSSIHPNRDVVTFENDLPTSSRQLKIKGISPQTKDTTPSFIEEKSRTSKDTRSVPTSQSQPTEVASSSFVPLWVRQAPTWLKIVFLVSVLLLVGAMVLVVVGLVLAMSSNDEDSNALTGGGNGTFPPSTQTTLAPVATPTIDETLPPTFPPSDFPSTTMPSQMDADRLTIFVTMGELGEELEQLSSIPTASGNSFLVHLGNWNTDILEDGCEDIDFDEIKSVYSGSSVPVYFVVGDSEYGECSDPASALDEWRTNLVGYESEHWESPPYQVSRSERNPELFAIEMGNTVVLSLNVGQVQADGDDREASRVSNESLRWIAALYEQNWEVQRNFILLSSQIFPGNDDQSTRFFENLLAEIPTYDLIQFYWIQVGDEQNLDILSQYDDIENLDVITVVNQPWPLLRVVINTSDVAEEPITFGYAN